MELWPEVTPDFRSLSEDFSSARRLSASRSWWWRTAESLSREACRWSLPLLSEEDEEGVLSCLLSLGFSQLCSLAVVVVVDLAGEWCLVTVAASLVWGRSGEG